MFSLFDEFAVLAKNDKGLIDPVVVGWISGVAFVILLDDAFKFSRVGELIHREWLFVVQPD